MKLHLVTTIPQTDGGYRYLLVSSYQTAHDWRKAIQRNPANIDWGRPDYAIDRDHTGKLTAVIYPGAEMTPEEWVAVKAAICG